MKKRFQTSVSVLLFGLLLASFDSNGQDMDGGSRINPEMSLKIAPDKTEYVQLEPINLRCSFTNETNEPQTTIVPDCLVDGRLFVESDGEERFFNQLSIFTVFGPRFPITFQPSKGVEKEIVLDTRLDEFFPRSGIYTVRLAIVGPEGKFIESNSVELIIEEPKGIDKEAFDFIQKNRIYRKYPTLFAWNSTIKNKAGKILLEEFVTLYEESIYGEPAIFALGTYYRGTKQFQKAKAELEKLKSGKNPRIVKAAKAALKELY